MIKNALALPAALFLALATGAAAQAACSNQVAAINPQIGGAAIHVTFVDPANCGSPLIPSSLTVVSTPNASGQVSVTDDSGSAPTGKNFRCLVGGNFTFTVSAQLGPAPTPPATYPQTALLVTCGVIPAAIVPVLE